MIKRMPRVDFTDMVRAHANATKKKTIADFPKRPAHRKAVYCEADNLVYIYDKDRKVWVPMCTRPGATAGVAPISKDAVKRAAATPAPTEEP
jgi:hypothetical protein